MIIDLLRSNGSIVVNKNLAFAIGTNAAIVYSELISKYAYFQAKGTLTEDGFFYNKVDNLYLDTGLGEKPQRTAINKLIGLGLIKMENRGLPRTRYFKINLDESIIASLLSEGKRKREALEVELEAKNAKKKESLTSYFDSNANREELEPPIGRINNNKFNNPKEKIKDKNIYLLSDEEQVGVFSYYASVYKAYTGKSHPPMNKEKIEELRSNYYEISIDMDIQEDTWLQLVDYHFENKSPHNDGNILSFLAFNGGHSCIYRYLNTEDNYIDY